MVKLLKVSLLILIAITMAEAGFYFFVYSKNKSGVTDKPDTVENNIVSVGSDSLDDVVAKDIVKQSLKDIESSGEPLINPQIIEALAKLRRNESHKLTISQEIRGKLASITYHENGTMVLLTIADKNGKTIDVTSIRTDDNNIYKIAGSDRKPIRVSDLKIGDNITHFSDMMISEGISNYRFEVYEKS